MAILTVGPTSTFPTIGAAMAAAGTGDIVALETGYGNENVTVTVDGLSFDGGPSSTDVNLQLTSGISAITLLGTAPINVLDGPGANTIVGNDGDNIISVSSGVDVVTAGNGTDRLVIDYSAATAAITGTLVGMTDGGTHAVTFTGAENFTISTGSGNDTITVGDGSNVLATGAGDDTITAGNGPNVIDGGANNDTITAGSGVNTIFGGSGNDTIVAGDGGNTIDGGNGDDGITTGAGNDVVNAGLGNDTIITGGGADVITVNGGVDTVDSGSESDRLIVDFSSSTTAVSGGVTGGTLAGGYDGAFADGAATSSVVFQGTENFTVTTGSGNDIIATGDGDDVLDGGAGSDQLNSGGGNDTLLIGLGNDALDGGAGTDAVVFSAARANYQVTDLGGGVFQSIDLRAGSPDGTDTLVNMEGFVFTDGTFDAVTVLVIAPTTTVSTLAFSADTGISNSDFITSIAAQDISGTLSADLASGESVEVSLDNGATWATATATVGTDTFSFAGQTLTGSNVLEARVTNSTASGIATTEAYVLDTVSPNEPSTPVLASASDSGAQGDEITAVTTPTVTGTAEPGSTVNLYDTDGTTVLGTSLVAGDGTYSIISSALSGGSHTLSVTATDSAGNVSLSSSGIAVTIDTTAPAAPTLALAHDTGSSATDGITSDPTIAVTAESGATLLYKLDAAAGFSATAPVFATDGSNDGAHTVLVEQQDAAGNIGAASSLSFTLDTTAPAAPSTPVLTSASDSGVQGDGITNVTTSTVAGTAEAGSTVTLYDTDSTTVLGTSVTAGDGTYSITSSTLSNGNHTLSVSATDTAGSVSAISPGTTVTIDNSAPAAPIVALTNDTGSSATDAITSDPTIGVTAESGATLLYKVDAAAGFSATAPVFATDGSNDGLHTVLVEQQDAAGNIGAASSLSFILDTTAPAAPTLALAHDTGSSPADGITSDPTIGATAEGGATLLYKVDGDVGFSATAPVFTADGLHTVQVEQQDAAGNIGAASSRSFTLDTTAPAAPTLALAHDTGSSATDGITSDPTFGVTAESGATLLYRIDAAAGFSAAVPVFSDGAHTVMVEQQDSAGNISAASSLSFTLDTTAPAAPILALTNDTGSSSTDAITSDPTIGVTAESGATLLYKLDAAAGFSATAPVFATDGSNDGLHTVQVEQQDAAGNIGAASSLSFTLDTTAPAAPTVGLAHDTGFSATDAITSDATIGVTAESGATLLYKVDAAAAFSAMAPVFATDGSNDGLHTVQVEQQDAAGNIGAASSLSFTLDTTAPAAPTVALQHDTGSSATDGITNNPTIVYTSAETGGFFLYEADGAANFSFAVPGFATNGSADGSHTVSAAQQDAAGNIGAASSLSFMLDTVAPNVTGLSASLAGGAGGTTINFTLAFDEAVKVAGGTPALLLNNGDAAAFDATATAILNDSFKLVFDHSIATPVSFVEVTAFAPHGSVVADLAGNIADVSHVVASFTDLADNSFVPPHMPFAFDL